MPHYTTTPRITPEISNRLLTINLIYESPEDIWIRSCDVLGEGYRSRFSFTDEARIEDVLTSRLAHSIAINLRKLPNGAHVLALPEFLIELPGLVLSGLHIMVTEVTGSLRSIILRFKEFIGAANYAFQPDVGFEAPLVTHAQKLAVNVLEDICLPLLNLCHTLDDLAQQQGQAPNEHLRNRVEEFRFQTELLKRFAMDSKDAATTVPARQTEGFLERP